jgi:hypothetical protein
VIQVAEELIDPMHRRQMLVAVAEVVLAELPRGVAEILEELPDRRVFRRQTQGGARHPDLGEPGPDR